MEYTYQPCEEYILINCDPDLTPNGLGIKIDILDLIQRTYRQYGKTEPDHLPDNSKMINYGLPPEQQVFHREEIPPRLISLEKHIRNKQRNIKTREQTSIKIEISTINQFWETLEEKAEDYKEEIAWIERMWYYRIFGCWIMLNGRGYYMTGQNFFYVNFTEIPKAGFPQYRDRDRRWYIAKQWLSVETRTFKNTDIDGIALPEEDGSYEMIDLGKRVFYGGVSAKSRRVGETSKAANSELEVATRTLEKHLANQGADEESSQRIFNDHIMFQFRKLFIIWKPLMESMTTKSKLSFVNDDQELSLGTHIDFASSKKGSHYDGKGLAEYYGDEVGKVTDENILKRHTTIKLCCSERDRIDGNITYTSTVEEMDKESGLNFLQLCKASKFYQRKDNGQTQTGMVTIFFRASDGLPSHIDQFGFSIEKKPLPYQREYLKSKGMNPDQGAYDYLIANRKGLTDDALSQEKRQNSLSYREIFTPPANNNFLPVDKIERKVTEIRFGQPKTRTFDLAWSSGFGSKVILVFPEKGKEGNYLASFIPPENEQNRSRLIDGVQYPEYADKYICSADVFRLDKTTGGRMSNGGVGVRLKRDPQIDTDRVPIDQWTTCKQIVYASYRPPTTDEFCEDVLKLCIFYGCMCYPESDIDHIQKFFTRNNYEGYLLFDTNEYGEPKEVAGYSSTHSKVKGFNFIKNDLSQHVHRCELEPLLNECLNILGLNDLTNYDGFSAYMGCMLAEQSTYAEDLNGRMAAKFDTSSYFKLHQY